MEINSPYASKSGVHLEDAVDDGPTEETFTS